jgi:proteasome accessory factor A
LSESSLARLHVIFFDNTLAHGSTLLKVGVMQMIVAMIEAGYTNPALALEDPVEAAVRISHDPTLETRVAMASGQDLTAVELQYLFLEEAAKFAASGGFEGIVPRADEILQLWGDTLDRLRALDWPALAPRLDWVLKLMALERAMERRPELDWNSSGVKLLDHLYASLGGDGLYWAYEESGFAERRVTPAHVQALTADPPGDTRAWTRAMLLRRAAAAEVESVDWDSITFRLKGRTYWPTYRTVELRNPLRFTRAEMETIFAESETLESLVEAVDASDVPGVAYPGDQQRAAVN